MSVVGQPSVLYLRRSQPSSRYQPSRLCSSILASTSSSLYGLSLSFTAMAIASLREHYITTPPLMLMACPVMNRAPGEASQSAAAATSSGRPQRLSGVDSDPRRQAARQALAVGEHPALDGAEQLGVLAGHAGGDVVPAHVHDDPTPGLLAHDGAGGIRARDGPLEVHREQEIELALPLPAGGLAREHVRAGVVDPYVESAERLAGVRHQRVTAGPGAHVGLGDQCTATPRLDPLGDRGRRVRAVAVGHEDRCARATEGLGDGSADAAARAGDDGPYAVERARARLCHLVRRRDHSSVPPTITDVPSRPGNYTIASNAGRPVAAPEPGRDGRRPPPRP